MLSPTFRLSISSDGSDAPDALRAMTTVADQASAKNIWIATHLFHREPVASAMAVLSQTQNLGVALMAMSPYVVHPIYATMAAATIDEFFPGRIQLCFGVGAPRDLEAVGLQAEQPLRTLRESIEISRSLLAGDAVRYDGQRFKIAGRRLLAGVRPVPLWLAASGPQMLELAGEVADGVVISAGTAPAFIRWCLDHVRRGEEKARREIAKAGLVFCSVDANAETAHNRLRRKLAYLLRGQHHARNLQLAGTQLDQIALAEAFAQERWQEVEALITDDVLANHTASGTPEQAQDAFVAFQAAGLDEIIVYGVEDRAQLSAALSVMRS
jgi:5,10-methylenetetrahydromethanopterin reductase